MCLIDLNSHVIIFTPPSQKAETLLDPDMNFNAMSNVSIITVDMTVSYQD